MNIALSLAAALLFCVPVLAEAKAQVGKPAPDFTLTDSYGKEVKLSSFRENGKVVVLEWHNHQCPYVRKHYGSGNMPKLQKDAAAKGVVWLSVISSAEGMQGHVSGEEANANMKAAGAEPAHVLLDASGEVGRLYGAKTTPHMYVIDAKGVLRYNGAIDSNSSSDPDDIPDAENYVVAALDAVLAGKPVKKATTRPYGCSVKYKK